MKAILAACLLAACAFAFAIGVAQADSGGNAAAAQPVQQQETPRAQPRDDCPEKDGGGSGGSSGSAGGSDSELRF